MPTCKLYTSVKDADLKDGIELRLAKALAKVIGKPEERMTVVVLPGTRMSRLGSLEPSCFLQLDAIGVFDKTRNATFTPPLKKILTEELSVPDNRCVIVYTDMDPDFVGLTPEERAQFK